MEAPSSGQLSGFLQLQLFRGWLSSVGLSTFLLCALIMLPIFGVQL